MLFLTFPIINEIFLIRIKPSRDSYIILHRIVLIIDNFVEKCHVKDLYVTLYKTSRLISTQSVDMLKHGCVFV